MEQIKWKRPSGSTVETNDSEASIDYAEAHGWECVDEAPDADVVDARGLPWDERLNTKNKAQTDEGHWKYKQGMNAEKALAIEAELLVALAD